MLDVSGPPISVGRYRVLYEAGSGGMGVVYCAEDPELVRQVALKLVRAFRDDPEGSVRLRREAEALARLNHPNIVPIYDFAEHHGRLFAVMRYMPGGTVRQWLRDGPHGWPEVLDVFIDGGRGLAAAHAANIVHRDVKPGNMMFDENGIVQVTDFGLAQVDDVWHASSSSVPVRAQVSTPALTCTGRVMGTPAYMSPEQLHGERITAASDQFSLCVALFEALTGGRPFADPRRGGLAASLGSPEADRLVRRGSRVPGGVMRAVVRGLARRPEQRWPDVAALLDALERERARAGRPVRAIAVAVGVLAALAVVATSSSPPPCPPFGVGRARRTEDPTLSAEVHAYLARFDDARRRVCSATAGPSGPRNARVACLQQAAITLNESILGPEAGPIEMRLLAVVNLPDPSDCTGREAALGPPLSTDVARLLVRAELALRSGAADEAEQWVDRATRNGHSAAVRARVELNRGRIAQARGRTEDTHAWWLAAYTTAVQNGDDAIAAEAANGLAYHLGIARSSFAEAERWLRHSETVIDHGRLSQRYTVMQLTTAGAVHAAAGDLHRAHADLHDAQLLIHDLYGPNSLAEASLHVNLADLATKSGDNGSGIRSARRAYEIRRTILGPHHPRTLKALDMVAVGEARSGNLDGAEALLHDVIDALDPESGSFVHVEAREHLGTVLFQDSRPRAALRWFTEARTQLERVDPDDPLAAARIRGSIGATLYALDEYTAAADVLTSAVDAYLELLGPDHPLTAKQQANLAAVRAALSVP